MGVIIALTILIISLFTSFTGVLFRCIIAFQIGFLGIGFVLAGGLLLLLFLLTGLLFVAVHHLLEFAVLAELLLLLLLAVVLPLSALLVCAASRPGLRESLLVFEDGFVVDVFEGGNFSDEGFAVVGDFFVELVVLDVEDGQLGHLHQDFGDDGLCVDVVVGEVEGGQGGTLQ
jgi:hypothetical protein